MSEATIVKKEKLRIFASSVDVGHGNPAAMWAILFSLDRSYQVDLKSNLVKLSAKPVRWMQKRMSQDAQRAGEYTENGHKTREGLGAQAFGLVSAVEILAKNPELIFSKKNQYDIGIFVQEHQLMGLSKARLDKLFPKGKYLIIPDVYPKSGAIKLMQKKGIVPVVWNREAFELLKQQGLQPILIAPFLPDGFIDRFEAQQSPKLNKVVIKSGGSGIPQEHLDKLVAELKEDRNLTIHLPDAKRFSYKGSEDQTRSTSVDNYLDLYTSLHYSPPRLLISYPSEMIQVAASLVSKGWTGEMVCLPPRGSHELKNLEWAVKHGVVKYLIDFGEGVSDSVKKLERFGLHIVKVSELKELSTRASIGVPNAGSLGLGSANLYYELNKRNIQTENLIREAGKLGAKLKKDYPTPSTKELKQNLKTDVKMKRIVEKYILNPDVNNTQKAAILYAEAYKRAMSGDKKPGPFESRREFFTELIWLMKTADMYLKKDYADDKNHNIYTDVLKAKVLYLAHLMQREMQMTYEVGSAEDLNFNEQSASELSRHILDVSQFLPQVSLPEANRLIQSVNEFILSGR